MRPRAGEGRDPAPRPAGTTAPGAARVPPGCARDPPGAAAARRAPGPPGACAVPRPRGGSCGDAGAGAAAATCCARSPHGLCRTGCCGRAAPGRPAAAAPGSAGSSCSLGCLKGPLRSRSSFWAALPASSPRLRASPFLNCPARYRCSVQAGISMRAPGARCCNAHQHISHLLLRARSDLITCRGAGTIFRQEGPV